jgi:hypothetical protein
MAQAGFTPIQLYFSTTSGASGVPTAGNLTNGELAINITDGKLFYKDNLGAIQVIGTKGGVGTSTSTQVLYNASGLVVGSANLLFDGTTLTAAGLAGPHNGTVGATTPSTGAFTTLSASSTVSGTGFSNYLASPPAIGGTAPAAGTFTTVKAIAAATQDAVNLQGRAGGSSSFGVTLTPTTLTGNRTLTLPDASGTVLQSGTAVTIAQGGTGQTTAISAFNALSPITSLGDLIIGNGSNSATRLAISPTAGDVLTSNGTTAVWAASTGGVTSVGATTPVASSGGSTPTISLNAGYGDTLNPYASKTANFVLAAPNGSAGVPTFRAIVAADIPTLNQNTTGTASNVTGTVATANGGTGLSGATPFTSGGVLYASSQSALASSALLGSNAIVVGGGAGSAPLTRSNITSDNLFLQLGAATPLRFADSDSSNYVSFQAPATITSNVAWTLPATDGGVGQFLSTNGAGTLSWATASGGGTPSNPANSIQFNSTGAFGGSANLTWDGTNVQIGSAGALRFADTDSSNYVAFKSPGTVAANVTWTLPATDGTASQVLSTNGSGTLSWATATATASPLVESQTLITSSYSLAANKNAMSFGATTIAPGVSVTIPPVDIWIVTSYFGTF